MTKEVLVSLKGLQFEEAAGGDRIETIVRGEYYQKNNSHFVLYEEVVEGSPDSVRNVLRFSGKELNLTKRGMINTHIVFEENKKSLSTYATPFGDILMGIDTHDISLQEETERILLTVEYDMEINYQYAAKCRIEIDIRPAGAGEISILEQNGPE